MLLLEVIPDMAHLPVELSLCRLLFSFRLLVILLSLGIFDLLSFLVKHGILGQQGSHTQLQTLLVHIFEDHGRSFADICHHTDDELRLLLQCIYPRVHIFCVVVENTLVKAHAVADHGSCQLSNEFLLGILRVTEVTFHVTAKTFLHTSGVPHLMGE